MTLTKTLFGLLLLGVAQAQFTTHPSATDRELLIRSLTYGDGLQVDSLPGKLPPGFNLTLPAGSQLVGSIVTRTTTSGPGMNVPPSVRVFFDHAQPPAELQDTLARLLKTAGFQPLPMPPGMPGGDNTNGFQASAPLQFSGWYKRNPDQIIHVTFQRTGAVTQVSLTREETRDLNQRLRFAQMSGGMTSPTLPKLSGPPGSNVMPQGSGSSGDDAHQTALIQTTFSAEALLKHYRPQLEKQGWTLVNQTRNGPFMLSTWSTKGGGLGVLNLKAQQKGFFRATLNVYAP